MEKNMALYPVEVKKTAMPSQKDIRHFALLDNIAGKKRGPGALICLYPHFMPLTADAIAVPAWEI